MDMNEIWVKSPDFDNYLVSNKGNIYSLITGKILKQCDDKRGYKLVNLKKDGKSKTYLVHIIIARTFFGVPEVKSIVQHLDGNKANNDITNLRWIPYNDFFHSDEFIERVRSVNKDKKRSEETIKKQKMFYVLMTDEERKERSENISKAKKGQKYKHSEEFLKKKKEREDNDKQFGVKHTDEFYRKQSKKKRGVDYDEHPYSNLVFEEDEVDGVESDVFESRLRRGLSLGDCTIDGIEIKRLS